jgi:tripartite-type tricarboxylate transporter receptor subunit TctC
MTTIHRRTALGAMAGLLPLGARAQGNWPERTVTLIVPFAPGGATDMIGRLVAEALASCGGYDSITVDLQHGMMGFGNAVTCLQAIGQYVSSNPLTT